MEWEYKLSVAPYNDIGEFEAVESLYNKLGKAGWELVVVFNGVAYFKRPLIETDFGEVAKRIEVLARE